MAEDTHVLESAATTDNQDQNTEVTQPVYYTDEELKTIHPTAIDLEKVDPKARPIVETTIKEYKNLQGDYTRKSQRLAELEKPVEVKETYFEDPKKDEVFKNFLSSPLKVVADINSQIAELEAVIPEDGADEYRKARRAIAYWNSIKDEFSIKRQEVIDRLRQSEIDEAKFTAELGANAHDLMAYAQTLGFSEKDFRAKPELRTAVKQMYTVANAGKTAAAKEVKPKPHQSSTPSGQSGIGDEGGGPDVFDPKLSTEERIEMFRKQKST